MKQTQNDQSEITISGLLPCPVRLPLLEGFNGFIEQYTKDTGVTVSYKFEAASLGSDWMEEHIQKVTDADQLPD
ncbi:iron ABC transporter substrate-binding protein, partial [bacterium]|nr:iron ABC transporter substrate-binding protein [bacterium]